MRQMTILAAFALATIGTGIAKADGRPLIWNVSRIGENGVKFRAGLRWPSRMEPSAGVVTKVIADETGTISAVPVSVWGTVLLDSTETQAMLSTAEANLDYDAAAERARFLISEKKSWIESSAMDVVSRRSMSVSAGSDGSAALYASQTVRLEFPALKVAMAATGSADSAARAFTKTISVEKAVFRRVKLTANVSETDRKTSASMRFDYAIKW